MELTSNYNSNRSNGFESVKQKTEKDSFEIKLIPVTVANQETFES